MNSLIITSKKIKSTKNKLDKIFSMYLALIAEYTDAEDPKTSVSILKLNSLLKEENKTSAIQYAIDNYLAFKSDDGKLIKTVYYRIAEDNNAIDIVFNTRRFPIIIGSDLYNFIFKTNEDLQMNKAVDLFLNDERDDWKGIVKKWIVIFSQFILKLEKDIEVLGNQLQENFKKLQEAVSEDTASIANQMIERVSKEEVNLLKKVEK